MSELRTAVFAECGRGYFAVFREDSREIVAVAEPAAFRDAVDGFAALQQIQCGEIQFLIQNETLRRNPEAAVEFFDEHSKAHMCHRSQFPVGIVLSRIAFDQED